MNFGDGHVFGDGIKDGRGYGPYGAGYYTDGDGCECPYGPRGERLSTDYDYQCGPGGYLKALRPPRKILSGYDVNDVMPEEKSKMDGLDCLGCDVIGFDWMQLAKGAASGLSGAGDMMSDKKDAAGKPAPPPPPPPKPSVGIGTILLGVGAATLGGGILIALARR